MKMLMNQEIPPFTITLINILYSEKGVMLCKMEHSKPIRQLVVR